MERQDRERQKEEERGYCVKDSERRKDAMGLIEDERLELIEKGCCVWTDMVWCFSGFEV